MIFYKLIAAFPVFLRQSEASVAESCFTHSKNTANIMMKTLMNWSPEACTLG